MLVTRLNNNVILCINGLTMTMHQKYILHHGINQLYNTLPGTISCLSYSTILKSCYSCMNGSCLTTTFGHSLISVNSIQDSLFPELNAGVRITNSQQDSLDYHIQCHHHYLQLLWFILKKVIMPYKFFQFENTLSEAKFILFIHLNHNGNNMINSQFIIRIAVTAYSDIIISAI